VSSGLSFGGGYPSALAIVASAYPSALAIELASV
jgi:hypothetical protein